MKIDRDVNEHVAIREQVLREISPEFLSRIYWHDIQTNEAKSQIITADTDGLIGIAHGSGNSLHLARTMATAAADQIRLRGRVMRHDVGQHVDNILADLEMNGVEL
jgi:phosphoribosylamine-glycine ligase